jgi:CSLREA domain-containing protein
VASYRCSRLAVVAVIVAMQAVVAAIGASPAHAFLYFVHTLADNTSADGVCSLREAILAANNTPANTECGPGNTTPEFGNISISVPGTIVLGAALPTITNKVLISGHSSSGSTLDGNGRVRPFVINPSVEVILDRLTITNAKAPDGPILGPTRGEDGGAIHNSGRLRLTDVRITHSAAGGGSWDFYFGYAGGHGGAIYNAGTIVGYRVTFDENSAGPGGQDQHGIVAQGGHGGAIYNAPGAGLILFAATFTRNAQGQKDGEGSALYSSGAAIIKSSTFDHNGIFLEFSTASIVAAHADVALSSTIVSESRDCKAVGSGRVIDNGYNLGFVGGVCPFFSVSSIVTSEPVLETELRNNGGYVSTLALVSTSPARDKVPTSFEDCAEGALVNLGLPSTLTDARGVERPQNVNCDMGAYEIGPSFRRAVRTLEVTGAGSGHGTVSGDGLDCAIAAGASTGQCSAEYVTGTVVTPTATAAADSIFVGWEGDPECDDGSVLMDGDKGCTAIFDLRGLSVSGSASGVGKVPPPGSKESAQVKFSAAFAFAGVIDLASATVTINVLLGEEEEGGAGELVPGVPIVLRARPGGRSSAATFETPSGVTPRFRVDVQIKQPSLSTVAIEVDQTTLPRSPQLCSFASRPATTNLTTMFTIDDGIDPPVTVTTREPWRCLGLAPTGGNAHQPRSLRTP